MTNSTEKVGNKRLVVGAGYGFRDWIAQRLTAVIIAAFIAVILVACVVSSAKGYQFWAGLYAMAWFKGLAFATFVAIAYHAWIGMRDIWMDYVKPTGVRLVLHTLTIVWLVACLGYALTVLTRV